MLVRARTPRDNRADGFTLIELLVVIIIIGILAAIAIPVFLSQRTKGYDAQVRSDLRNAATAEETYLSDYSAYTTSQVNLSAAGWKKVPANTVKIAVNGATGYCMVGTNASSSAYLLYDSVAGGLSSTVFSTLAGAQGACTVGSLGAWA